MTNRRFAPILLGSALVFPAAAAAAAQPRPDLIQAAAAPDEQDLSHLSIEELAQLPVRSASKSEEPLSEVADRALRDHRRGDFPAAVTSLAGGAAPRAQSRRAADRRAQLCGERARLQRLRILEQIAGPARRTQPLFHAPFGRVLGPAPAHARGYRADRGDQRPGRHALRPQCGERRHQHRHPRRARHDRRPAARHLRHQCPHRRRPIRVSARRGCGDARLRHRRGPRRPARRARPRCRRFVQRLPPRLPLGRRDRPQHAHLPGRLFRGRDRSGAGRHRPRRQPAGALGTRPRRRLLTPPSGLLRSFPPPLHRRARRA